MFVVPHRLFQRPVLTGLNWLLVGFKNLAKIENREPTAEEMAQNRTASLVLTGSGSVRSLVFPGPNDWTLKH